MKYVITLLILSCRLIGATSLNFNGATGTSNAGTVNITIPLPDTSLTINTNGSNLNTGINNLNVTFVGSGSGFVGTTVSTNGVLVPGVTNLNVLNGSNNNGNVTVGGLPVGGNNFSYPVLIGGNIKWVNAQRNWLIMDDFKSGSSLYGAGYFVSQGGDYAIGLSQDPEYAGVYMMRVGSYASNITCIAVGRYGVANTGNYLITNASYISSETLVHIPTASGAIVTLTNSQYMFGIVSNANALAVNGAYITYDFSRSTLNWIASVAGTNLLAITSSIPVVFDREFLLRYTLTNGVFSFYVNNTNIGTLTNNLSPKTHIQPILRSITLTFTNPASALPNFRNDFVARMYNFYAE